jgi:hypothetical protein
MIDKILKGLQSAIKITIEVPTSTDSAPAPCDKKGKKYKLKKKSKGKSEKIDDVELGDTQFRQMLPDMNSTREKSK